MNFEEKLHFVTQVFHGERYAEHTLPVEVLREFEAYKDLVVELAKALFLEKHPGRQRVPKGFVDGFQLRIRRIDPGSAASVLDRAPSLQSRGMGPLFSDATDEFDEARDLISECIAAVSQGRPPSPRFPTGLLSHFNNFGQRLLPNESIEIKAPGAKVVATYTTDVRKRLILSHGASYLAPARLNGRVCEVDKRQRRFQIVSDGDERPVGAPYPASLERTLTAALDRSVKVQVSGTGVWDRGDRVERFESVSDVSLLVVRIDVEKRIQELRVLQPGWLDGEGKVPEPDDLQWLGQLLRRLIDEEGLPDAHIYPTAEGGAQLEWSVGEWEVSATLDFRGKKTFMFAAHTKGDIFNEAELDQAQAAHARQIASFVSAFVTTKESSE
jgi:hypothetical protein